MLKKIVNNKNINRYGIASCKKERMKEKEKIKIYYFSSKRETVSLKLVLLLDNGLQNQRHFIVNFGRGVKNTNGRRCERDEKRE